METGRSRVGWAAGTAALGAALCLTMAVAGPADFTALVAVFVLTALVCAAILLRGRTAAQVAALVCHLMLAVTIAAAAVEAYQVADVAGGGPSRIEYHGKIDPADLFPRGVDREHAIRTDVAYPSSVPDATESVPDPTGKQKALYALQQLLPFLLAIAVLALLAPLLRAASGSRPFGAALTRRVTIMGWLLLLGIPAAGAVRFLLAYSISELGFDGVLVHEPAAFKTAWVLPGLLVLGLAVVFRRGEELQELEEHTV